MFPCLDCGKGFLTNQHLNYHVNGVHRNLRPFCCSICNKTFSRQTGLMNHQKEIHEKAKTYCPICKKPLVGPRNIQRHIDTVHLGLKPYNCHGCEKSFGFLNNLQKHLKIAHKKSIVFTCSECGQKFDRQKSLQIHQKNLHDFNCSGNNNNNNIKTVSPKEDLTQKKITNFFCTVTINK
jgi:KRAB domain-containing zinc finger protein